MNALEIIDEIKHLPPGEQARVLRFVRALDDGRQWTGQELHEAAWMLAAENDPGKAQDLKERIVAGLFSRTFRCGQGRIRHNSLRSAFGTYSGSSLTSAARSGRGAYHFSEGKCFFTKAFKKATSSAGRVQFASCPSASKLILTGA